MPDRLITALLLLAVAAVSPARATERVLLRDYPALPGATLKIDTYRGSVDVRESPDDRIHVEIHEDPGTDEPAEADRILGALKLDVTQDGATVSIVARNPSETGVHFVWQDRQKIVLAYAVLVPRVCNLDLATNDGGISVDANDSMSGRVAVRARKGTVFLRWIDGNIKASVDTGDIIVSRCTGAIDLTAYVGNIRVGTVGGYAELHTTNGDIDLQHALGGVKTFAEVGDITVGLPGTFHHDSNISTNGGAITVRLDPAAHCSVQASSIWGRVRTALPFAVESGGNGKKSLVGRLNGGGALLQLHADGGHVRIDAPRI
jgi:hypothetical protein